MITQTDIENMLLSTYDRPLTINIVGIEREEPLSVSRQKKIQEMIDRDWVEFDRLDKQQLVYKLTNEGIQARSALRSAPKRVA